jgi:hypothetical protein
MKAVMVGLYGTIGPEFIGPGTVTTVMFRPVPNHAPFPDKGIIHPKGLCLEKPRRGIDLGCGGIGIHRISTVALGARKGLGGNGDSPVGVHRKGILFYFGIGGGKPDGISPGGNQGIVFFHIPQALAVPDKITEVIPKRAVLVCGYAPGPVFPVQVILDPRLPFPDKGIDHGVMGIGLEFRFRITGSKKDNTRYDTQYSTPFHPT